MTVSAEQRSALSRAVARLRRIFEEDFAAVAEGKFGIHTAVRRAGELDDVSSLSLSAQDLAARAELVGVIDYLKHEGLSPADAVDRMLREAVFTTVNRLLAIRVAEAIAILPPSLAQGRTSQGFLEAVEAFPLLRDVDTSGGYWTYLQICGDELSHAVPRLFDRRHPLTALAPSAEAVSEAVEVLADAALVDVWTEPEALGWSYQFFNTSEERRAMRESAPAPRDSRELAVRNQFFTPRYVVDFLVQNTLGRRLRESGFDIDLPLLVGEVDETGSPLDLNDVAVLDPAVGSGHFLLGAYDLLENAFESMGTPPSQAAAMILRSLYGIEIDPRAAQVAQAVLYLRARRSAPEAALGPPAIVTARSLPKDLEVRGEVLSAMSPGVRDILEGLDQILDEAPVLGSLLKPEEFLSRAIGERMQRPRLGDELSASYEEVERAVVAAASQIAKETSSTPADRLFAADANDALRFVELCNRRYDAVLMNPPFGEPVAETKDYLLSTYVAMPANKYNILAPFIERGLDLCNSLGYMGAITARSAFFLQGFERWRREVILDRPLPTFLDLGFGVMEEAMVEAAAYVLSNGSRPDLESVFIRLLKDRDRAVALHEVARDLADGEKTRRVFLTRIKDFAAIPGCPFAYSIPRRLMASFRALPTLGGPDAEVRQGLATADDFRFVRAWWEVPAGFVGHTASGVGDAQLWVPFAKGGDYSPFFGDLHLVVDWTSDGKRIKDHVKRRYPYLGDKSEWVVKNTEFYFLPGLTWPERTNSAFGAQILPRGSIFSAKGPFVETTNPSERLLLLAWLNSRLVRSFIEAAASSAEETRKGGVPSRDYSVGLVKALPWIGPGLGEDVKKRIGELALDIVQLRRQADATREPAACFAAPWLSPGRFSEVVHSRFQIETEQALQILEIYGVIDDLFREALDLTDAEVGYLDETLGPVRVCLPESLLSEEEKQELLRLSSLSLTEIIDAAVEKSGDARHVKLNYHVVDRRLETISLALSRHPSVLTRSGSYGVEEAYPTAIADDLISYLLGTALGRWDIRIGKDPSLAPAQQDPFEKLQVTPPGMLIDEDGLPTRDPPEEYPLALPPDPILHDDPGHPWDVQRRVEAVAEFLFDDSDQELREALRLVKSKSLRSYLRGRFFSQHLSRYSKSRRKAPIYWYLAVPSRQWGLWVYAPWLSREQLFAIARAAQDKLRRLSDEASQLQRDVRAGGGREVRERLEAVEALVEEVEQFARAADRVAQSGWEPDLNDGIILNAAPLEQLFADAKWRKDVAEQRKKMEKGGYPWATVQLTFFKGSS